ncbi:MAG: tetratricopeptide repeat protein, partial [Thermoanaerobaculales bacterium]
RPFLVALAVVSFAAAMLAKEMAVVLPFWVFLIAALHDRTGLKRAALRAFPFVVVVAAYAVLRLTILQVPPPGQPLEHTLTNTLLSAPVTIVRYLGWMILPLDLNAYVQNPYVTTVTELRFLGSVAVLAVLAAVAFHLARRNRQILLFSAMLAVSFLPVLNIVRVASPVDMGNTMAERFCYFPSFPFLAAVLVAVPLLLPRVWKRRRSVWATTVILFLLVPSVAITWDRAGDWRDEVSLFSRMARQAPEATLPWSQLALSHLRKGNPAEAWKALERAERIDSADLQLLSARTSLLVVEGRALEAIPLQERLVRSAGPGRPQAMNNLAYLYRVSERPGDARRVLEQIIDSGQAYADVWFNLGEVEHQDNNFEEAITAFERAWKSDPTDPQLARRLAMERVGFARILARTDRRDEAVFHLQKVLIQTDDAKLKKTAITELDRLDAIAAPSESREY